MGMHVLVTGNPWCGSTGWGVQTFPIRASEIGWPTR